MELYSNIVNEAFIRNISIAQIERDLGFSKGSIGKWEKSNPSINKVLEVADYFHISMDGLLGRKEEDIKAVPINLHELLNNKNQVLFYNYSNSMDDQITKFLNKRERALIDELVKYLRVPSDGKQNYFEPVFYND